MNKIRLSSMSVVDAQCKHSVAEKNELFEITIYLVNVNVFKTLTVRHFSFLILYFGAFGFHNSFWFISYTMVQHQDFNYYVQRISSWAYILLEGYNRSWCQWNVLENLRWKKHDEFCLHLCMYTSYAAFIVNTKPSPIQIRNVSIFDLCSNFRKSLSSSD